MGGGRGRFQRVTAAGLGAAEIILGVAVALLTLQGFTARVSYYFVMQGLWAGVIFLICGCVTLAAATSPSRKKIKASLWLAVIAAIVTAPFLGLTCHSLAGGGDCHGGGLCPALYCSDWSDTYYCLPKDIKDIATVINISGVVLGVSELGVAIAIACLCCDCNTSTADSNEASTVSVHDTSTSQPRARHAAPPGEHTPYQIPLVIQMPAYQLPNQATPVPGNMDPKFNVKCDLQTASDKNPSDSLLLPVTVGNYTTEATGNSSNKVAPEPEVERYAEMK